MREVLFPSCTPQERRPKCRAEGLDRPVYIGLGVGLRIHQTPSQFGTANYHWSLGYRRIRKDSTQRAAWLIWGRCPVGPSGSFPLQPVPCLSRSCVGGEGHGRLVYQIYLVYRELCLLVQYTCPIVLPLISGL